MLLLLSKCSHIFYVMFSFQYPLGEMDWFGIMLLFILMEKLAGGLKRVPMIPPWQVELVLPS